MHWKEQHSAPAMYTVAAFTAAMTPPTAAPSVRPPHCGVPPMPIPSQRCTPRQRVDDAALQRGAVGIVNRGAIAAAPSTTGPAGSRAPVDGGLIARQVLIDGGPERKRTHHEKLPVDRRSCGNANETNMRQGWDYTRISRTVGVVSGDKISGGRGE